MNGLAKPPFTLTTENSVIEDERRVSEAVKAHTDSSHFSAQTFLSARRTELSAFWKALKGHSRIVCRLPVNSITPPILNAVQANRAIFRVLQSKEDDEDTECISCIQSSVRNI